jgi:hypothetical protein
LVEAIPPLPPSASVAYSGTVLASLLPVSLLLTPPPPPPLVVVVVIIIRAVIAIKIIITIAVVNTITLYQNTDNDSNDYDKDKKYNGNVDKK